jgi:transcriptional regulator with GAF, ATPase, and Fis domain
MPEDLFESELYGYERGAFTSAHQHKPGLLELADGGTFFIDELGDIPLRIQVKLLRVLQ